MLCCCSIEGLGNDLPVSMTFTLQLVAPSHSQDGHIHGTYSDRWDVGKLRKQRLLPLPAGFLEGWGKNEDSWIILSEDLLGQHCRGQVIAWNIIYT